MQVTTILLSLLLSLTLSFVVSQSPTPTPPPPPPPQGNLYPITAEGFDMVLLDDMSFLTEINYNYYNNITNEWDFYIYGSGKLRTVYPGPNFYVGKSPFQWWQEIPFVDMHTFQTGNALWAFGPTNPTFFANGTVKGYQLPIAIMSDTTNKTVVTPLDIDGMFFSALVVPFDPSYIIAYFVGFYPDPTDELNLRFGLVRAHFNETYFLQNDISTSSGFISNFTADYAAINLHSQYTTYHNSYKPFILHTWNVSGMTNVTITIVADPMTLNLVNIYGNYDPTVPLVLRYNAGLQARRDIPENSWISSVALYYPLSIVVVGIAVPGMGTGFLLTFDIATLTQKQFVALPTNCSDPKALVIDEREGILYVGPNGGGAVLKYDILTLKLLGQQGLPFWLHRAWAGVVAREHVYFTTHEQHSKVFRVAKTDFCSGSCLAFGYCQKGQCVCPPGFSANTGEGYCEWPNQTENDKTIRVEKGGETALGVLFALTFVAAAAGWYLVWKSKRNAYHAV